MIEIDIETLKEMFKNQVEIEVVLSKAPPKCMLEQFDKDTVLGLICNCPKCILT